MSIINTFVLTKKMIGAAFVAIVVSLIPNVVFAQCSRPIVVPVSATGFTGMMQNGKVSGIIPQFLNEIGTQLGCQFTYTYVPKNRQEHLFETGQSDLLFIATKTPEREKSGLFIPFVQLRPTFITFKKGRSPVNTIKHLMNDDKINVIVVRGQNYSEEYMTLLSDLQRKERLIIESDPQSVIKMMRKNSQLVSIMSPTIFIGTLKAEFKESDYKNLIRFEGIEEFPWNESGLYISKVSLSEKDQKFLYAHLNSSLHREKIWELFKQYFDGEEIQLGLRKKTN